MSPQLNGLDGRENLARDLGITEAEGVVGGPLLLEVVRKCQQKKTSGGGEVSNTNLKFLYNSLFIFFLMTKKTPEIRNIWLLLYYYTVSGLYYIMPST